MEEVKVNDKKLAMRAFFDTYSHDVDGTMLSMGKQELLEHLGTFEKGESGDLEDPHNYSPSDIFVACASAASGINEHEFLVFAIEEYFEF